MFSGSLVALVTPMHRDGRIDVDALRRLVDWHVESGTTALVSVGTTGESATLSFKEHAEVIRMTVEFAAGRVPVIAGTGANATREAIALTRDAQRIGAQASLLVTPYYNKPTQEGLYQHYRAIAAAVDMPHILYNVPSRTGCDMLPATVERLAGIDNIIGLKEAVGDMARVDEHLQRSGNRIAIFSGDDASACAAILRGARGDISVTANVAPAKVQAMCQAALAGNHSLALALDAELQPLHKGLFVEPNPIPVKWALQRMGRIGKGIRLPLTPLPGSLQGGVERALVQAGCL